MGYYDAAMNALRMVGRFVLSAVALVLMLGSLAMLTVSQLAGSPAAAGATVGALIDDREAATVVGALFVEKVREGNADLANLTASDEVLFAAAAEGLQAARADIVAAVEAVYTAAESGQAATIDATPVFTQVLTRLHAVEPAFPETAPVKDDGSSPAIINIKANPDSAAPKAQDALGKWWLLLLIALAALGGVGALGRGAGLARWRVSAALLTAAGIAWIAAGKVGANIALGKISDADARNLAEHVLAIATSKALIVGAVAFVIGVAVIVGSYVRKPAPQDAQSDPDGGASVAASLSSVPIIGVAAADTTQADSDSPAPDHGAPTPSPDAIASPDASSSPDSGAATDGSAGGGDSSSAGD